MRSPWSVGTASLTWLMICGALGSGALNVMGLWVLGTCLALLINTRGRVNQAPTAAVADAGLINSQDQRSGAEPAQLPTQSIPEPAAPAGPPSPATADEAPSPQGVDAGGANDDADITESLVVVADQGGASISSRVALDSYSLPGLTILTAAEVARVLTTHTDVVERAMASGHLPGNELDGTWMCSRSSFLLWLDGGWRYGRQRER